MVQKVSKKCYISIHIFLHCHHTVENASWQKISYLPWYKIKFKKTVVDEALKRAGILQREILCIIWRNNCGNGRCRDRATPQTIWFSCIIWGFSLSICPTFPSCTRVRERMNNISDIDSTYWYFGSSYVCFLEEVHFRDLVWFTKY